MLNAVATTVDLHHYRWPADVMTVAQVAETVRLTPKTVRLHIRVGRLRAVRFGQRGGYRVCREDAQAWVEAHVVSAAAPQTVDQLVAARRSLLAGAPAAAVPPVRARSRSR